MDSEYKQITRKGMEMEMAMCVGRTHGCYCGSAVILHGGHIVGNVKPAHDSFIASTMMEEFVGHVAGTDWDDDEQASAVAAVCRENGLSNAVRRPTIDAAVDYIADVLCSAHSIAHNGPTEDEVARMVRVAEMAAHYDSLPSGQVHVG